jgi:uncharacterized repeat protein (TIGR04138 family)
MDETAFMDAVRKLYESDARYHPDAYVFVRHGLDYTVKRLGKQRAPKRHVTGKELVEGIREYAIQQFGPMALTVLRSWGIGKTHDFGEIVFNLVNAGILGKTEDDRKEDFNDGYDFDTAFVRPFLPQMPSSDVLSGKRRRGPGRRKTAVPGRPGERQRPTTPPEEAK